MLGVGYLLSMNQRDESTIVEVDGKSLRLTHLSKVMFPEDGFTKAELLLYYQTVAPVVVQFDLSTSKVKRSWNVETAVQSGIASWHLGLRY